MFSPAYTNDSTSIEKKLCKVAVGRSQADRMSLPPRAAVSSTNIKQDNTEVQFNMEPPTGVLLDRVWGDVEALARRKVFLNTEISG